MDRRIAGTYPDKLCVCAALRSAGRASTQLYDLVLQPTGLKATQFIALQTIEQAGELPQWQFARQHAVAVETLSRRLAVLRRRGLVSVRTGRNHCERIYRLTEEGKMALARAMPYWERAQERLRRTLGDDETQMLLRLCENTVAATQEAEELRTSNGNSEAVRITSRSSVTLSALPASTTIPKTSKSLMRAA